MLTKLHIRARLFVRIWVWVCVVFCMTHLCWLSNEGQLIRTQIGRKTLPQLRESSCLSVTGFTFALLLEITQRHSQARALPLDICREMWCHEARGFEGPTRQKNHTTWLIVNSPNTTANTRRDTYRCKWEGQCGCGTENHLKGSTWRNVLNLSFTRRTGSRL